MSFKYLKQIGKGSFSKVFLFENVIEHSSSLDSLFFQPNRSQDQFFIIKEVDLLKLVSKSISRKTFTYKPQHTKLLEPHNPRGVDIKQPWNTTSVNVTPYCGRDNVGINAQITEEDYYYNKFRELIESEILVLKHFNHPCLVKFLDCSFVNDVYSIKMQYCEYGDLYYILKGKNNHSIEQYRNRFGGFNNQFVKKFLVDATDGLKYIHEKNIIHRDIKLHNFLVHSDYGKPGEIPIQIKISDFGFCCFDASETEESTKQSFVSSFLDCNYNSIQKKYYKVCGTPYYMAPEMLGNLDKFEKIFISSSHHSGNKTNNSFYYNKKIDLWSLGICVYELLFNLFPFSNTSDINELKIFYENKLTQSLIHKNIDDKYTIDLDMKFILKKLLTLNPIERISTQELLLLVQKVSDKEIHTSLDSPKTKKHVTVNMDSWVVEESKKEFNNLTSSTDNNFIKWLGLTAK